MKRALGLLVLFAATIALGQDKNPVTSVIKEMLPHRQQNMIAAAEAMPAEKYSYRPTEPQMTFGHLILHVIQSNNYLCSKISGVPEVKAPAPLKESDGKDKLVAALKASFEFCSTNLAKVDDSKLGDELELFGGRKGTRAFALFALSNDWADHYSAEATYLRLNGQLPPTAQPKK